MSSSVSPNFVDPDSYITDDDTYSVINSCATNVPPTVRFCGNVKFDAENVVPVNSFNCTCTELDMVPVGNIVGAYDADVANDDEVATLAVEA